jgi:branched-chain amino acid transport system permease protein
VGLWLFQEKTRTGAVMRAGMDDKQMTIGLGINYGLFSSFIFFLGAFLGGLAGFLGTPIIGIQPGLSFDILLFAVIVIVVGGVGNVQGALLGAILIGIIDGFGKAYFPDFAVFTIYLAMIIILLSRPYGLLGRPQWETAAKPKPGQIHLPAAQAGGSPILLYGIYILIGIVFMIMPPFASPYVRTMIIKIFIYGIFALSLNLLFGYAGLFSLGHAAFFGVGAYTAAILISRCGIDSFWIVILLSLLAVAISAAFFGVISLKVSGIYFLLVTLAVGQLLDSVAVKWRSLTGGSDGIVAIPYPDLGVPWLKMTSTSFYYFVLVFFALCFFLLYRVARSPFGQTLQGIRGDEGRMQCLGYNTWLYKYITFIIGGLFAGIAGVLSLYQNGFVGPGELGVLSSTTAMLMVILGSDRVFWGPLLGAALVNFLEYISSLYTPERWPLILGGAFVLAVTFLRGGVSLHLVRVWRKA